MGILRQGVNRPFGGWLFGSFFLTWGFTQQRVGKPIMLSRISFWMIV
jgi:hypothetical protein